MLWFYRDLIEQTEKVCPSGTAIPSNSTVKLSFAPKNIFTATARRYTGVINLQHRIQRRQLRAFHVDAHYCNAQRKYVQFFACQSSDVCKVSYDDKAKLKYGEPGHLISSGTRGRSSIIPSTSTLIAEDHDVHNKGSITPSVILDIDIPDDPQDSFYRGKVCAILKDSVYEPSNSFRTVYELEQYLRGANRSQLWEDVKILIIYTDGGTEHNITHESVKIPLCLLFQRSPQLELLVALRTAPGQSYINYVERTMSILNIGFQNVALERYVIIYIKILLCTLTLFIYSMVSYKLLIIVDCTENVCRRKAKKLLKVAVVGKI